MTDLTTISAPEGIDPKPPILTIDQLSIAFPTRSGSAHAVDGVSLELHRGEVLGVVGESGSGKSLTAMSIIGLLPLAAQVSGSVVLDGVDTRAMTTEQMRRVRGGLVGTIFQDPLSSLNPVMTIGAQLVEAVRMHDSARSKAEMHEHAADLLGRVGIKNPRERLGVYPHELSGGMRQRVMIAMSIANSPALLIADEPTTALDVTTQVQVLRTLDEVRASVSAAMILISHDLGVIADVADRVAVMYHGRVVESGPSAQVLADPQHPYTAGLLRSRPTLRTARGSLIPIPGSPPRITARIPGCAFEPRCSRASADAGCTSVAPELVELTSASSRRVACFLPGVPEYSLEEAGVGAAESAPGPSPDASPGRGSTLTVENLTKIYPLGRGRKAPRLTAVDSLTIELQPGRTLALVGESGCGKTTAARSILRLVEPTSASIRLGDTDVVALGRRDLRSFRTRAQLVFQDPTSSLNPRQTVGDLIAEPMMQQGLLDRAGRQAKVDELLSLVSMYPEHADRYPSELSGGQRQRVAIARSIGLEPELLVLDEPVSALDVSIQAQVLRLLVELQKRLGIGYLFISHDLGVVHQLADDIAVMYLGRVVEFGPADRVLGDPRHPYTQLLVRSVPGTGVISGSTAERPTDIPSLPDGCRFADRCPLAVPACAASRPPVIPVADDPSGARSIACHRPDEARAAQLEVLNP